MSNTTGPPNRRWAKTVFSVALVGTTLGMNTVAGNATPPHGATAEGGLGVTRVHLAGQGVDDPPATTDMDALQQQILDEQVIGGATEGPGVVGEITGHREITGRGTITEHRELSEPSGESGEETTPFSLLTPMAAAQVNYGEIFTGASMSAAGVQGTTLSSNSTLKAKWNLSIPEDAKSGDEYTITVKPPFYFKGNVNEIPVADGQGAVFAHVNATDRHAQRPHALASSLTFTLTGEVENHADIQGFIEAELTWVFTTSNQVAKVEIKGAGTEIGPSKTYTIPAQGTYTNVLMLTSGVSKGKFPAVHAVSVALAADLNTKDYRFQVTPVGTGMHPTCRAAAYPVFKLALGGVQDLSAPVIMETVSCDANTGKAVFKFPAGTTTDTSTYYAWRVSSTYITDEPHTSYTMNLETKRPDLKGQRSGPSGNPPEMGVDAPSILTEKTVQTSGQPVVGDTLTYQITTRPKDTNARAVFGITTKDTLPNGLKFVSASGGGSHAGGSTSGGGVVTWPTVESLAPGAEVTYTLKAQVVEVPAAGSLTNTVTNTGTNVCNGTDQVSVCEAKVTTTVGAPSFKFQKHAELNDSNANGWLGDVGDKIHYTFTVTNTGSTTLTTALLDDDKLGIHSHECLAKTLAPTESATCPSTWEHTVTSADTQVGEVINTATLTVPGLPPKTSETTTPVINPAFTFTKEIAGIEAPNGDKVTGGKVIVGDTIFYQFKAKNVGNVAIDSLRVTDPLLNVEDKECLPAGFSLPPGETVTCKSSAAYSYKVTDKDTAKDQVENVATGEVPGLEPQQGKTNTPIVPKPNVPDLPDTGGEGIWAITVFGLAAALIGGVGLTTQRKTTKPRRAK